MSRFHSYLNSAASILQHYKGTEPFSNFLRYHFAQHKKFGSKDRKQIAHLCYCYFRLGQALLDVEIEERILSGFFLCEEKPNEMLQQLKPDWNELVVLPHDAKASMLNFSLTEIFPWTSELNLRVNANGLASSFLVQPDLFLRLRPGKGNIVKEKLTKASINFTLITHSCISLSNSVKLDDIINPDAEAVVQDYNSQRVGEFLDFARNSLPAPLAPIRVFDCCAARGGKSILAFDILKNIVLTATDVRESILINLRKRFARAGITKYQSFVIDLVDSNFRPSTFVDGASNKSTSNLKPQASNIKREAFDIIICDAPCTGSGTWSRTPEQLYYFQKERVDHYAELQKSICTNVIPLLKKGGCFLYVTCSVFKKENEDIIEFLQREHGMQLEKMEMLTGYDKRADSMFAALLRQA